MLKVWHLSANTNNLAKQMGSWNVDTSNCSVDLGESWVPGPFGIQFSGLHSEAGVQNSKLKGFGHEGRLEETKSEGVGAWRYAGFPKNRVPGS